MICVNPVAAGTITLAEAITGPAKAVLTLLIEEPEVNEETLKALAEPIAALPRFSNTPAFKADLDS